MDKDMGALKARYGIGSKTLVPVTVGQWVVRDDDVLDCGRVRSVATFPDGSQSVEVAWNDGTYCAMDRKRLRVVSVVVPVLH